MPRPSASPSRRVSIAAIAIVLAALGVTVAQPAWAGAATALAVTAGGSPVTTLPSGTEVALRTFSASVTNRVLGADNNFAEVNNLIGDGLSDRVGWNPSATPVDALLTQTPSGSATVAEITFPPASGIHNAAASYPGDSHSSAGTSTAIAADPHTELNTPTVALGVSSNPATYETPETFTATVTGSGPTPTGSVTFMDGSTTLGTVTLNSSGVAAFTTSTLATGTQSITANYSGDSNYAQADSNTVSLAVNQYATASVTPNTGTGTTQQFQFTGASTVSGDNLLVFYMLISPSTSTVNSCYMKYVAAGNLFYLMNNAGTTWSAGEQPGSSGTLSNSQCSIPMSSLTVTGPGSTLTVSPAITFTSSYDGLKNVYLDAINYQNEGSGFQLVGTWTVGTVTEAPPTAVSVTPNSGNGLGPQQFSFVGSSTLGASNLSTFYMYINAAGGATANACYLKYIASGQMLYLYTSGSFGSGGQVGSSGTLSNSICSVNLAATTVTPSGNSLAVAPDISFTDASPGTKNLSLEVVDHANESSGFVQLGTWTVIAYEVVLTWDAPASSPDPVSGYNIYRATNGSSFYQLVNSEVIASTGFTDYTVLNNTSYTYYVESVDAEGNPSIPSGTFTISTP
jgi:hypothetical protein